MRVIAAFILSGIISFSLSAQEKGHTSISLVLEPVISWMKSDYRFANSNGSLPGYNFGIKIDRFFGDNYAFATGLTINTAGGKIRYYDNAEYLKEYRQKFNDNPEFFQEYRLKHIEIPLGLRLRSDDLRRINIYGRFGLSPQINIKASDGKGNSINNIVRLFDLSYHLGSGIEYSLGRRNALMFGLIFNNGFVDITKNKDVVDKAIMNRFTFEFGFIF